MSDEDYETAVTNALRKALQAEYDCQNNLDIPSLRPTAADTWACGEKEFSIEIGGHELLASIPSTKSSVSSEPNEADESDYDRDDEASSCSEDGEGGEEHDDDEEYDDEYEGDDGGEYEEDYQFTRGDFENDSPTVELAQCKLDDGSHTQASAVVNTSSSKR
jgi:hypothetical protein